jgi:hypothetical protein
MIVERIGYLKLDDVLKLAHFSIYETHKGTNILIENTSYDVGYICYPKEDRLPWKILDGKKICNCVKIFDSKVNSVSEIDMTKWNGKNQIMSYREYCL